MHQLVEVAAVLGRRGAQRAGELHRPLDVVGRGVVEPSDEPDQVLEHGRSHRAHVLGRGVERKHALHAIAAPFGTAPRG